MLIDKVRTEKIDWRLVDFREQNIEVYTKILLEVAKV